MDTIIYRELSPEMPEHVMEWLENQNQLIEIADKKGKTHFIVENDTPRPAEITEAIVGPPGCTLGFGVYTLDGERIGMYASVAKAEQAAGEARIQIAKSDEAIEWDSLDG